MILTIIDLFAKLSLILSAIFYTVSNVEAVASEATQVSQMIRLSKQFTL
jgi:hypothetical protein